MAKRTTFTLLLISLYSIVQAQKGELNIAAGPVLSFPVATESRTGKSDLKTGIGLEALGQYNVSNNSTLLLKSALTSWGYKKNVIGTGSSRLTFFTLQGGYKYQFGPSGFFINGLAGTDIDLSDGFATVSFTLGAGKRIILKDAHFIDAGIDLVGGDAASRVNIKALVSLFR